jgi:hypothetical protein
LCLTVSKNLDIYVMNDDGSDRKRLTSDDAEDRSPRWSPDGKHIVFVSKRSSGADKVPDIFIMNADGSGQTNITKHVAWDDTPAWTHGELTKNPEVDSLVGVYAGHHSGGGVVKFTIEDSGGLRPLSIDGLPPDKCIVPNAAIQGPSPIKVENQSFEFPFSIAFGQNPRRDIIKGTFSNPGQAEGTIVCQGLSGGGVTLTWSTAR